MVVRYDIWEEFGIDAVPVIDSMLAATADPVVCRCLQVTESMLTEAEAICPFTRLCDIAQATGAGTGCTACHRQLRKFLKRPT